MTLPALFDKIVGDTDVEKELDIGVDKLLDPNMIEFISLTREGEGISHHCTGVITPLNMFEVVYFLLVGRLMLSSFSFILPLLLQASTFPPLDDGPPIEPGPTFSKNNGSQLLSIAEFLRIGYASSTFSITKLRIKYALCFGRINGICKMPLPRVKNNGDEDAAPKALCFNRKKSANNGVCGEFLTGVC